MDQLYPYQVSPQHSVLQVLAYLRTQSCCDVTIAQICDAVALSRTTVRRVVIGLLGRGIITHIGKGETSQLGGKPPQVYRFNPDARVSIGLAFSTDELFVQVLNLRWEVVFGTSIPVAYDLPVEGIASYIHWVLEQLDREHGIRGDQVLGIAVGIHGIVDSVRGLVLASVHSNTWCQSDEFVRNLAGLLGGGLPVYVDNAVRFRLLSECQIGVLQGVQSGVLLHGAPQGSMVAGILLDGQIRRGVNSLVGAVGHLKLNVNDREQCDCGGFGCFEMQVGDRRLVNRYREFDGAAGLGVPRERGVVEVLFQLASEGDAAAVRVVEEVVGWFGIALQNIRLLYDPEVIVFQGVFARLGEDFSSRVQEAMGMVSFTDLHPTTAVVNSDLPESVGAFGAALYAMVNSLGP
jgi:predicted NBD/HSP70 family sugar kinase